MIWTEGCGARCCSSRASNRWTSRQAAATSSRRSPGVRLRPLHQSEHRADAPSHAVGTGSPLRYGASCRHAPAPSPNLDLDLSRDRQSMRINLLLLPAAPRTPLQSTLTTATTKEQRKSSSEDDQRHDPAHRRHPRPRTRPGLDRLPEAGDKVIVAGRCAGAPRRDLYLAEKTGIEAAGRGRPSSSTRSLGAERDPCREPPRAEPTHQQRRHHAEREPAQTPPTSRSPRNTSRSPCSARSGWHGLPAPAGEQETDAVIEALFLRAGVFVPFPLYPDPTWPQQESGCCTLPPQTLRIQLADAGVR